MKSSIRLLGLLVGVLVSWGCEGQDFAPNSLTAELLTVTIASGTAPLASTGSYKLFTSAAASNYTVLGKAGTGITSGIYTYSKTGTNTGTMSLADAQGGSLTSVQLTFSSTNTGGVALTKGAGTQSGIFVLNNFVRVTLPQLFLPNVTNNHFNAFLSGQAGFNYAIQSSSNATTWNDWTNVPVNNATTNFSDTSASAKPRFYRAKIDATAFAPLTITNQTFNFTIANGALPLPTNGIFQFLATNGTSFQVLAGPGLTNGAGNYTYATTGGDSGGINYTDASSGVSYAVNLVYTSPRAGHFYLTAAGGFESGTFTMMAGVPLFMGNVKFTPDTARGTTKLFAANGTPLTLTVTNATGYIWQLALPADALVTPRVLTMTPFTNIDSSQSRVSLVAGVQLEPDGIQFSDAVTLSVTPPSALGTNASIMLAGDDGSSLYLVVNTNQSGTYSTKLAHFTSAAAANPSPEEQMALMDQYTLFALFNYQNARLNVLLLLNGLETPPPPPDYDLSCDPNDPGNASQEVSTDIFISTLFFRETEAIRQLKDAALELLSIRQDPTGFLEAPQLSRQLVEFTEFMKVNTLFWNYGTNPKKLIPLIRAAEAAESQDRLNQGSGDGHFESQIQAAGSAARDFYFDKLKTEHDYSVIMPVLQVQQVLNRAGGGTDDNDFYAMLEKELTFHLTLEIKLTASAGNEDAMGDFTLNAGPNLFPCTGSGTLNYLSGSLSGGFTLVPGQSFGESAALDNIDACSGMTIGIVLSAFAASSENYSGFGQTIAFSSPMGNSARTVFQPMLATSGPHAGQYVFNTQLHNRSAQAVSQTISGFGTTGGSVSVTFTLVHTPQ